MSIAYLFKLMRRILSDPHYLQCFGLTQILVSTKLLVQYSFFWLDIDGLVWRHSRMTFYICICVNSFFKCVRSRCMSLVSRNVWSFMMCWFVLSAKNQFDFGRCVMLRNWISETEWIRLVRVLSLFHYV